MKSILKSIWRWTFPARRPIQARIEAFVARCVARALEAHNPTKALADEVNLVLDAVIAEHFRLQARIEELQRVIHEGAASDSPIISSGCR